MSNEIGLATQRPSGAQPLPASVLAKIQVRHGMVQGVVSAGELKGSESVLRQGEG